jgi:tetratricopeptide (TPR) repeat protein
MRTALQRLTRATESGRTVPAVRVTSTKRRNLAVAAGLLLAGLAVSAYLYFHRGPVLTEKDAVVVGDFTNSTGDSVYDDTLKQGLEVQLEQSPFIDFVSERRVNETLKLMGRSPGDRLTPDVAREVCQRAGGTAVLAGLIAALGRQYVIGLEAVNCATGEVLAQAQEQAPGKEAVLKALDHTALALRAKLGESRGSLQKYATSLEDATTPSFEALKAYSEARKAREVKGSTAALPLFRQAAQLDPNFAMAYANMSHAYQGLNQIGRSTEYARKAYELRGKVSERERFYIEATYYLTGIGDLERARQSYEQYQQVYPRDSQPYEVLAFLYTVLGNPEKALEEQREALRLDPTDESIYAGLAAKYMDLHRLGEAETVLRQAEERKLDTVGLFAQRYELAFLKGDTSEMERLAAEARGKPGAEDIVLGLHADTQAGYGRLRSARELWRQAEESARRNDAPERAAYLQSRAAVFEVELGERQQASADANAALKQTPQQAVMCQAALVFARAGGAAKAEQVAATLDRMFPSDTQVQRYWLPTVRAAIALERGDPRVAVELTKQTLISYDPLPSYVRGMAYLLQHDGSNAAVAFRETFQKIPVRPGSFQLARLGLARALAVGAGMDVTPDPDPPVSALLLRSGRRPKSAAGGGQAVIQSDALAKARAAYQDFLTSWKDADPDIPILKQAKAEYSRLQ